MALILTLAGPGGETRTLSAGTLSIGRAPGNDWVLADPERHLSKTHCVLSVEDGRFMLTDLSTNGIFVNGAGTPTERGSRSALTGAGELRLGAHVIRFREGAAPATSGAADSPAAFAAQNAPGADAGLDDSLLTPPGFAAAAAGFHHPLPPAGPASRADDPFDLATDTPARLDAEDDLFRPRAPAESWQGPSQRDDVDAPFQAFAAPKPIAPANPAELDFDALIGDDPFSLGTPSQAAPPPPAPIAAPAARSGPPAAHQFAAALPLAGGAPPPAPISAPMPAPMPAAMPPAEPAPPVAATQGTPGAVADGLAAFLAGAGMAELRTGTRPEAETLAAAGAVFRVLVEGLREVLMSRAAIKNEFRVEQTMLRARDNNALKFSVTPEEAMAALLLPDRPGYKPPLEAAREAFGDIKSHELAVMAGVQTALLGLLKRFDPAALEQRLQPGLLQTLLPAARKARIWELFCATYKDLAREAEDDFQSVFGREFARAYDAQTRKL